MNNLRIDYITIESNSSLIATFTENLNKNLGTSNVQILSQTLNTPSPEVLKVEVVNKNLKIYCQPLTPYAVYNVVFRSTSIYPFQSVNGESLLLEDNVGNLKSILGPPEPDNAVRDYLINFLRDNIYSVEDPNTTVYKVIESFVNVLSKSLYDVRQVRNENYLTNKIVDEEKVRGKGAFDRLSEEAAYEVTRVALTPSENKVSGSYNIDYFPYYPFTLQSTQINKEILAIDSVDSVGKFNINSLVLNVNKSPAIKLTKLTFIIASNPSTYEYDVEKLGYQLKDSTYDKDHATNYLLLSENQIRLNDEILQDVNFKKELITRVECSYQYKDLGKLIYPETLTVEDVLVSSRETLPPIINIFDLKYAPIVDVNNQIPKLNGATFTDPNSLNLNAKHPAFLREKEFRLESLPSIPGDYSIDYNNGRVYVYGADGSNTGTGASPPVATYNYRLTYSSQIDYVYDADTKDLVSLPKGNLRYNPAIINFNYEKVFVSGIDYVANVHKESLEERIENRLLNLGTLKVLNGPITNIFRIYNETSGEIYSVIRWNDDKVYFNYNIAPKIQDQIFERASFENILNELLFVNEELTNSFNLRIFKILLKNNNLIAKSEDCIGSSINSSLNFFNKNIFSIEKYFQRNSSANSNLDQLSSIGDYCVDYVNGIIYCAVSNSQSQEIGTLSYKKNNIITSKKHIISINDIYYQINPLNPKNKNFSYLSFGDNNVYPQGLQLSDENCYSNDSNYPYLIFNKNIGYFDQFSFYEKVTEQVKEIRGIFEEQDLINNQTPINFSRSSSFSGNTITVNPIEQTTITTVNYDGYNFYVILPENINYLSPNISFNIDITRTSDGQKLWDSNNVGNIVPGNTVKLILTGFNSPAAGQFVILNYQISINDFSRVTVNYNKGDLYVDYTNLMDEIIISYEYGDNVIDFRQSKAINPGDTYYVSYKVGALRDSLLKNFGSLLFVPELNVFNVNLERERYRDAISGALSSFIKGPTIDGIKTLVNKISHIDPEIVESIFNSWSLGNSLLYPNNINTTGNFQFIPVKFGDGVLVNSPNQSISFPRSSNFSINQGTFESWVLPQWDGIDNNATLSFKILKDNNPLSENLIFIGDNELHPTLVNGSFTVDKNSNSSGIPQKNKNGIFIYYAPDSSNSFNRWYVEVVDSISPAAKYSIQINSNGSFYDVKKINLSSDVTTTTSGGKLTIKVNNLTTESQIVTFISDYEYYLLDSGEKDKNRISIYKEIGGYLNFRIFDKYKNSYIVSADVSNWKKNEKHFIAASWKLNSENEQDEMHLFVDGFEVPNIIKYGQKLLPYPHENFRTINPEIIIGSSTKDIVGSTDLSVIAGSPLVKSSVSLGSYNINPGDVIYIDDPLFDSNGYTIISINGNELTLNQDMPVTLDNLAYSINKSEFTLKLDAIVYPSVAISTLNSVYDGYGLNTNLNSNIVTSLSSNFNSISPGYLIRILDNNFDLTYNILAILGQDLVLDQDMPATLSNLNFYIYSNEEKEIPGVKALHPSYSLSSDGYYNNILTITNNVFEKDLIILNTFGLNHRRVKQKHYVWRGTDPDVTNNVIPVRLPPPVSLNDVKINRIILTNTVINSHNSILSGGNFNFIAPVEQIGQPSLSQNGRTLTATVSGTDNVTFPVTVTLDGYNLDLMAFSETITINDYGKVDFTNKFISIDSIQITCTPSDPTKNCIAIEIREKYSVTYPEDSVLYPVIRYSYQMNTGYSLSGVSGNTVTDENNSFSSVVKDNILVISTSTPLLSRAIYKILDVSLDKKILTVDANIPLPSFINGEYRILNITDYRTGLQNGFFVLEQKENIGQPYYLGPGHYEFEYETYVSIKFDPLDKENVYLGCDINKSHQINAALDQVRIYSSKLSDTRVGEVIPSNQRSITKDYNSLVALAADKDTLFLCNFDSYPFVNSADFYIRNVKDNFIQSDLAINSNFENCVLLDSNPITLDNYGLLDTKKEGTIEFWVNPLYDSFNDPNNRYYFDAYGAKVVKLVSENNTKIVLGEKADRILGVTLDGGDPNINYFAGGKLELDTSNSIVEEADGYNNTVKTKNQILQVLSVLVKGDLSKVNYFENGAIGLDKKTIYLGKPIPANSKLIINYKPLNGFSNKLNTQVIRLNKKLPKDNSSVLVKFIPKGFNGDRISIYKDVNGYLKFEVIASNKTYEVATPLYWSRNTWHRVKASYIFNSQNNLDELRLFVDGYERSNLLIDGRINLDNISSVGAGITGITTGKQNISFKDTINQINIGSDYSRSNKAYCLIDNLRISNISRPLYSPFGEPLDVAYSSNPNTAFPVTKDLYTTYLLDFNASITKNEDFAFIVANSGSYFDFTVNIFDSFGIVSDSAIVKEILEKLIYTLKPANSRAYLQYSK